MEYIPLNMGTRRPVDTYLRYVRTLPPMIINSLPVCKRPILLFPI